MITAQSVMILDLDTFQEKVEDMLKQGFFISSVIPIEQQEDIAMKTVYSTRFLVVFSKE